MGQPKQNETQSQQNNMPPPPPPPFDGNEPNQDLYAPNLGYQKPPTMDNQTQSRSTVPQAFPPTQSYDTPHAYPPTQNEMPQTFPPPQSQPNVNNNPQFHQQTGGMQYQQHQPQRPYQQQVPMGQPIGGNGMPAPSPYNNNMNNGGPIPNPLPLEGWKTGLFDCMQEPENAIITACFPCVTFGQVAEIVDSGTTSCATSGMWYSLIAVCIAMPCIISCTYRTKMRALFGLVESPAPDWVIHCFCDWCALCQEYRELKLRGYDPAIGWLGNAAVQRQRQQAAAMTAPMQQQMM